MMHTLKKSREIADTLGTVVWPQEDLLKALHKLSSSARDYSKGHTQDDRRADYDRSRKLWGYLENRIHS